MNKQELENQLEELKKQLAKLEEKLNKPESKVWKPKVWKPKYGDTYYYIHSFCGVCNRIWGDTVFDDYLWNIGNCFKTIEEAEFKIERLKVITELKRFAEEHNSAMDWDDALQNKWFIGAYTAKNIIGCSFVSSFKSKDIYFSSREIAQQAIEQIGEDRIKKYYLGVE